MKRFTRSLVSLALLVGLLAVPGLVRQASAANDCTLSSTVPTYSGGTMYAAGSINCATTGYHQFRVRIRQNVTGAPDITRGSCGYTGTFKSSSCAIYLNCGSNPLKVYYHSDSYDVTNGRGYTSGSMGTYHNCG